MAKKLYDLCGTHGYGEPTTIFCATCARIAVERKIVLHTMRALIKAGYDVGVFDSEELTLQPTKDKKAIEKALFTTDEDYLFVHKAGEKTRFGWVRFIYGNSGPDVCNDYTTNLSHIMEECNEFADRQPAYNG